MKRLSLVVAWVLAAVAATGIAWGALSSASRQVVASADAPVLTAGPTPTAPSQSSTSVSGSSTPTGPTSSRAPATSDPSSSTTTSSPTTTTAHAVTLPDSTTTSTTTETTTSTAPPADWSQSTVPTAGGVVVVGHRPFEVRLDSATPAPGFVMEIEKQGPDEVRVEFEGDDADIEVRVRWEDGVLVTEVN